MSFSPGVCRVDSLYGTFTRPSPRAMYPVWCRCFVSGVGRRGVEKFDGREPQAEIHKDTQRAGPISLYFERTASYLSMRT